MGVYISNYWIDYYIFTPCRTHFFKKKTPCISIFKAQPQKYILRMKKIYDTLIKKT